MKKLFHILQAIVPPLLWAMLIFFLSSRSDLPKLETSVLEFIFKKSSHIFVYAVLYFLIWRAFYVLHANQVHKKYYLFAFILTFFYAISDEFHQSFVAGRTPTVYDIGFDSFGALISHQLIRRFI